MTTRKKHTTIKDIARELGLATSTVSMALNDHPRISDSTKKRVRALAKKHHYRPNIIARAMVRKRTHLIGLIITDIMSSFYPQIIQGIEDVVSEEFYSVILCATENSPGREQHYLQLLREKRVDGLIADPVPGAHNEEAWRQLRQYSVPMVSILQKLECEDAPYVIVDNYRGGYIATQHLIRNGHKTIAHLAGPTKLEISKLRKRGFKDALAEAGLPLHRALVRSTKFNFEDGYKKTLELLKQATTPTAIFACSDIVAIGAIQALRRKNLRVPEDIAVIGFDDLFFASFSEIPLTSVSQPKYEIGVRAARKILKLIEGKPVKNETLKPTIVERQSTGYALQNRHSIL